MTFDAEHKKSSQAIRSLRRRGTGGGARPAVRGRPPRVAKRSQRFAKSPRVRAPKARNKQHPRWGRCLFGTGGGARPAVRGRPPRVAKRSQRFAKSPRVRANTPGWGRCLFGTGGGARTHTVSPPADFESATSTIPSHRHTVEKYISSTAKFQVFSFSFLRFRCR